jgi:hypothetical protein
MFKKILLLITLLSYAFSGYFIPNNQNPLQIQWPTTSSSGNTLDIRFKLNSGNSISYGQVFGVVFPNDIITWTLNQDPLKYDCKVTNEDTGAIYLFSPIKGTESNVAYCEHDDLTATPLPTMTNLKLSLWLKGVQISTSFLSTIGLFTASSTSANRIYTDQQPSFGTLGLYGNWMNSAYTKPLNLDSSTIINQSLTSAQSIVYPYNTFDIAMTFSTNAFIRMQDINFAIMYPAGMVTPPTGISTDRIDTTSPLLGSLQGVLGVNAFTSNGVIITGISEDLVPGRKFKITLTGWTAKPDTVEIQDIIKVTLIYKNTYSVYSYNTLNIIVKQNTGMTITAAHPENWDIWRNAAWPMKFTITSPIDLPQGGYMAIEHTNAKEGVNRWSFASATCDMSANTSQEQGFGRRNLCYPLRVDYNYPDKSSTQNYDGSGVFFKVGAIKAGSPYIVTIWGFADNCGGDADTNFDLVNGLAASSVQFEFTASFVTTVTGIDKKNEDRLTGLVAYSSSTPMTGKCFNNKVQGGSTATSGTWRFDDAILNKITLTTANGNSSKDIALFREVYDWAIAGQTNANTCTGIGDCWAMDIKKNKSNFVEKYLYSSTTANALDSGSYFLIKGKLNKVESDAIFKSFALPYTSVENNIYNHKQVFLFTKDWFTAGESISTCYLSWGMVSDTLDDQHQLLFPNFQAANRDYETNFIGNTNVANSSTIDLTNSSNAAPFKIMSAANTGVKANMKFGYSQALTASCNTTSDVTIGLFTSCLKWTTNLPTIKSLYTYIDIQWQFHYIKPDNSSQVNRNNRFIKLYPEGGVFQEYKNISSPNTISPVSFHHVWGQAIGAVCLLEIDGNTIYNGYTTDSNTLALWIYQGTLLETDYTDASASYPVAPLPGLKAYGLQSALTSHTDNKIYTNDVASPFTGIMNDLSDANKDFNKTHYHFLLGSLILISGAGNGNITGSPSDNSKPNLLIPLYCPVYDTNAPVYANGSLPAVTAMWLKANSYMDIGKVNKYLGYKLPGGTTSIVVNSPADKKNLKQGTLTNASLKFTQYTNKSDNDNNNLFIFNSSKNGQGLDTACTTHLLFINKKVAQFDNSKIGINGVGTTKTGLYDGNTIFYILGKAFNTAFLSTVVNTSTTASTVFKNTYTDATSLYNFTGITRPTIEQSTTYLKDVFAYFCTSKRFEENGMLYNWASNTFNLDYNPSTSSQIPLVMIRPDKAENNFNNDRASSVRFDIRLPTNVPDKSNITFSLAKNNFDYNTSCGIMMNNRAVDCTFNNVNSVLYITCGTNASNQFSICCYNFFIDTNISLSSLTVKLPTGDALYDASAMINAIAGNPFFYDTKNDTANNPLNSSAKVVSYSYNSVGQKGAFHMLTFNIVLPRDPVRNMKLQLFGDMREIIIQGFAPTCTPYLGDNNTNNDQDGQWLWDSCDVSGLVDNSKPITVTTKDIIYKCGMSFSRKVNIQLWPVKIVNFADAPFKDRGYTVKMTTYFPDASVTVYDLAKNNEEVRIPGLTFTVPDVLDTRYESLCPLTALSTKVPGEWAEYQFTFDLLTSKDKIGASSVNRLELYFPPSQYSLNRNNIECYLGASKLDCFLRADNYLVIMFLQNLDTTTNPVIRVLNIQNPLTGITTEIYGCSVGWSLNEDFRFYIVGTGKNNAGKFAVAQAAAKAALRIMNPVQNISANGPRTTSTHQFFLGLDDGVDISTRNFNIDTPILSITFPSERTYQLSFYDSVQQNAVVKQYISDNTTGLISAALIDITSINRIGNRITVQLKNPLNIDANWRYLEIYINNVVNPINASAEWGNSTGPFRVMITNKDESIVLRSYDNTVENSSSVKNPKIKDSDDLAFLQYFRGNVFSWTDAKYIIDFNNGTNDYPTINVGRYSKVNIILRQNVNSTIPPVSGRVSIKDSILSTLNTDYLISSFYGEPIPMWIGVPCGTPAGVFFTHPILTSDNANLFFPMPTLAVRVAINRGTINFVAPTTVALGSTSFIYYDISEPNFDELKISWVKDNANLPANNISDATIPAGTVSRSSDKNSDIGTTKTIFSKLTTGPTINPPQKFTVNDVGYCFAWNVNVLTVEVLGMPAQILPSFDLSSNFVYYNSIDNKDLKKNAIGFKFTPNIYPVFLYCAVNCLDQPIPKSEDLRSTFKKSTGLIQYYKSYFENQTPRDIIFEGLIRNQNYRLTCIMESTGATLQSTKHVIEYNITNPSLNIAPAPTYPTTCTEYTLTADFPPVIQSNLYQDMQNQCQTKISATNGWMSKGCMVCTDGSVSRFGPGLSYDKTSCGDITSIKRNLDQASTTDSGTNASADTSSAATDANAAANAAASGQMITIAAAPTNTTVLATNGVTPITPPEKRSYRLCMLQNPTCATDREEAGFILQNLFYNTTHDLSSQLGINAIDKMVTFSDVHIDLTKLKIDNLLWIEDGTISWNSYYDSPLTCSWYYRIYSPFLPKLSFDDITSCAQGNCGKTKFNVWGARTGTNKNSLYSLKKGNTYSIYYACMNDLPYAQVMSDVFEVTRFDVPQEQTIDASNNTPSTEISSAFFNLNALIIFAFMMIFA